eukprot:Amastigsp_a514158_5.p3 type:complete len:210 gc:universal Amastigsp_a514158_5:44-673(+)
MERGSKAKARLRHVYVCGPARCCRGDALHCARELVRAVRPIRQLDAAERPHGSRCARKSGLRARRDHGPNKLPRGARAKDKRCGLARDLARAVGRHAAAREDAPREWRSRDKAAVSKAIAERHNLEPCERLKLKRKHVGLGDAVDVKAADEEKHLGAGLEDHQPGAEARLGHGRRGKGGPHPLGCVEHVDLEYAGTARREPPANIDEAF